MLIEKELGNNLYVKFKLDEKTKQYKLFHAVPNDDIHFVCHVKMSHFYSNDDKKLMSYLNHYGVVQLILSSVANHPQYGLTNMLFDTGDLCDQSLPEKKFFIKAFKEFQKYKQLALKDRINLNSDGFMYVAHMFAATPVEVLSAASAVDIFKCKHESNLIPLSWDILQVD